MSGPRKSEVRRLRRALEEIQRLTSDETLDAMRMDGRYPITVGWVRGVAGIALRGGDVSGFAEALSAMTRSES